MRVLYIGGSGEISQSCVARSVELGHQVSVFNRGLRSAPSFSGNDRNVEHIVGDFRADEAYGQVVARDFDVVCQFLAYDSETVLRDLGLFAGHCDQYVFISSASAYRKPGRGRLVTEDTPLENPHWAYSRSKAACEALLSEADRAGRLPVTIVRPSHTYRTRFPSTVIDGDHLAWRMLQGKPVIVHDDGQSLWTLTHSEDFARAFCGLLGESAAVGETVHITSDAAPSWNSILSAVADTLSVEPVICPIPVDRLVGYQPDWEGPLLGDKAHSMQFDNSRVRNLIGPWKCEIPLAEGLRRVYGYASVRLASDYRPDPKLDALVDRIIADTRT